MRSNKQGKKKSFFAVGVGVLALILIIATSLASLAHAQGYPSKTITMIVPSAPGGHLDVLGRFLAQEMGNLLKQRIIVENVAGGGTTIGCSRVAKSTGDGYTIMLHNMTMATIPSLYRKLSFDVVTDFEPIGRVADMPMVLVAKKNFPAKDFKEMVAYVKNQKDKINFANAGMGTSTYLCSMLFMSDMKTDMTMVPYKGGGPALNDLMGGQVDLLCDAPLTLLGQIRNGTIKAYAVTSPTRTACLPDVPTIKETGLGDLEMAVWLGMWAPKGTPKPIINKLSATMQEALESPLMKQRLSDFGAEPLPQRANPEALRVLLQAEIKRFAPIIKNAGVYLD